MKGSFSMNCSTTFSTIDALTKAICPCAIGKLVDSLGVKLMFMRNVLGLDFIPG